MTAHLLAISVGPVQEFIAAARRTRDLWFGSHILSDISKAVARSVRDQGGELIFPSPSGEDDLNPSSSLNVANVILAEIPPDKDPKDVAKKAKDTGRGEWRGRACSVHDRMNHIIIPEIWNDQIDDVVEFFSAWVSLDGRPYSEARREVMRLLVGRKNCRDFQPARGRELIPKSSLDGLRESALIPSPPGRRDPRLPLTVRTDEHLDAIGIVKRFAISGESGGEANGKPYPSVVRVAADPWLRGIGDIALRPFISKCAALSSESLRRIDIENGRGHPHYGNFPYEGAAAYRARHREFTEPDPNDDNLKGQAKDVTDEFDRLACKYGEPDPYLAVLVADGDKIGQALSRKENADQHRAFSQQLARFAHQAREIVNEKHRGVLVYAGGDDVLAFLPLDQSLKCARALHNAFGELMKCQGERITLSVGLAIAHFMDDLSDLFAYGRVAEKEAKALPNRDGLAIHLHKRGGGKTAVCAGWESNIDERICIDKRIHRMADAINNQAISNRTAYDILQLADVYENWTPAESSNIAEAIRSDLLRILAAKRPDGNTKAIVVNTRDAKTAEAPDATNHQQTDPEAINPGNIATPQALRQFANELVIARQLAIALRQANGGRP